MSDTLNQIIATWRAANQNHKGIMSKLTINGALYDIKDPAVEALASEIETRLKSVEGRSWTEVVKGADQPKFATAVTQSTDGSISVTYGSLRSEALNVAATDGVFITGVSQATDGVVSVSTGSVEAQYVGFTGDGWTATDAQNAIKEALSKAIGVTGDTATVATIQGAKAYAKDLVEALAGADVAKNAQLIQKIIQELEGSTDATAWVTLVDKLHGLATGQTVKQYVDTAVAGASGAAAAAIAALDATEASTNGKNVQVQVTQQDGKISGVSIITDNTINAGYLSTALSSAIGNIGTDVTVKQYVDAAIAGADADLAALSTEVAGLSTGLAALTTDIVNNEQVVATALNDLNTNKADKSAFATGAAVIGFTTDFTNDTLTITTATGAVWIPA